MMNIRIDKLKKVMLAVGGWIYRWPGHVGRHAYGAVLLVANVLG